MKKTKFPNKIIANWINGSDDQFLIVNETPEDLAEEYDGEVVGIYELVGVGKFTVEKQVDAKLFKKGK